MAEEDAISTGKYGSEPMSPRSYSSMPEHVDTAVDGMQASRLEPPLDRSPSEAKRHQLPPCDYPMLASRQLSKTSIPLRGMLRGG
jgi:hypothetical protein